MIDDFRCNFSYKQTLTLLLLTALGLAGNYFKFTIFFNVDFIFGSIFAIIALQIFGLRLGIISAAIISSMTWLLWSHPYAIVIMTCEVVGVGVLIRRRNMSFVIADAIYWLLLGMPLVYLFYHQVMGVQMHGTLIIMLKQALNGIVNALLARAAFLFMANRFYQEKFTFRETIFNSVAFFVLTTALFIMALDGRADFSRIDRDIRQTLIRRSHRAVTVLGNWVESKFVPIVHLAKQAGTLTPNQMQQRIEQSLTSQTDFLRMGLLDKNATTTAYSPLTDELGKNNIGKNFDDRPYIPILKLTLQPMLSEVVMGRIGVPKPFVSIISPVVSNGAYAGYTIGVLDFDKLSTLVSDVAGGGEVLYTVLDRNGNIIVTNRSDQKTMNSFSRGAGELVRLDDEISQWVTPVPANSSVMERWRTSLYVSRAKIGKQSEWELILEQPLASFQETLFAEYSKKLVLAFCILLTSLGLAELFSCRLASSIEHMNAASTDIPEKLLSGRTAKWYNSQILEINQLMSNFRNMEQALRNKFQELEGANALLEKRVGERTTELWVEMEERRKAEEESRKLALEMQVILNTATIGISFVQNRIVQWANPTHDHIFGCEIGKSHGQSTDIMYASRNDYETVGSDGYSQIVTGRVYDAEVRMKRLNGEQFWCRLVGRAVDPEDLSKGSIWVLQDISEGKRSEEVLRKLFQAAEQSPATIVIADLEGRIEYVNPKFSETTGYSSDEAIGQSPRILKSGKTSLEDYKKLWETLVAGHEWRGEFYNKRKDGSFYWEFASISPIRDSNGNTTHYMAVKEDITDRKDAEAKIKQSLIEKETLLKEIHHRVKNNMQVISSLLDLQAHMSTDENMKAMFQESQQRVQSMALVHEKLYQTENLSQIDFGDYIRTLANELISSCNMDNHRPTLRTFSIPIALDLDRAIPCALILNELISNCCKYAFHDTPNGEITVEFQQQEDVYALTVRDNGIGLPQNFNAATSETLGLQLVSVLAKQLRGTFRVDSHCGTEAVVTFPNKK